MRKWNIHEHCDALKTKLDASQKVSNGHPYKCKSGLAFNKMKHSTCINIKYCMNVTEELHFKIRSQLEKRHASILAKHDKCNPQANFICHLLSSVRLQIDQK